jgi:hypothetical protein
VAKSGSAPGIGVARVIVESADPVPVATIVYTSVTEYRPPEAAIAAATLVPIALKTWLPSAVTVAPVVVYRPLAVSIKVCSVTDQPVGKELDVKLLIHVLFTSVLPCEVTKILRVPPSPALILNEVLPRMFGNGSIGLPVAVIWFALNTPQIAGAHATQANDVAPAADDATVTGAGRGPAPGAAPIETVAALAAETQRNALAIPVRARSFALISIMSLYVALAAALGCL